MLFFSFSERTIIVSVGSTNHTVLDTRTKNNPDTYPCRLSFLAVPIRLWLSLNPVCGPMLSSEYWSWMGKPENKHPFRAHLRTFSIASTVPAHAPCLVLWGFKEAADMKKKEGVGGRAEKCKGHASVLILKPNLKAQKSSRKTHRNKGLP